MAGRGAYATQQTRLSELISSTPCNTCEVFEAWADTVAHIPPAQPERCTWQDTECWRSIRAVCVTPDDIHIRLHIGASSQRHACANTKGRNSDTIARPSPHTASGCACRARQTADVDHHDLSKIFMKCPHCDQRLGFIWSSTSPKLNNGICSNCGKKSTVHINGKRALLSIAVSTCIVFLLRHLLPFTILVLLCTFASALYSFELKANEK